MQLKRAAVGFSLIELAVVFLIVGLLVGGAIITLSGQFEVRNVEETQRRLEAVKEAILGFAIVNGRLPCPARYVSPTDNSAGLESFCDAASGTCTPTTALRTHGNCSSFYDGYVPAVALGLPVDSKGFTLDAWGNRVRYAIARDATACAVTPPTDTRIWTSKDNLRTYGLSCRPNDLDICNASPGSGATACASAARVMTTQTAAVIVYSTGKNGAASSGQGPDELENTDGANAVFVTRTPSETSHYDDQMLVVPIGVIYAKLLAAGILP